MLFITCLESPLTADRPTSSKDLYTICLGSHHLALTKVKGIRRKCWRKEMLLRAPFFLCSELTDHIQISHLAFHWIGIYLTHVPAPVGLAYLLYVQIPRLVFAVGHSYAVILCDHMIVDREDGLGVNSQPCHLKRRKMKNCQNFGSSRCERTEFDTVLTK